MARCTIRWRSTKGSTRRPRSRSVLAERAIHHRSCSAVRGRSARLANEVAIASSAASAPSRSSALASQRPAEASTGTSRSWRRMARSAKPVTSSAVSRRARPRSRSRTGPPSRSTCSGSRSQSVIMALGAKRASRTPMASGDSHSSCTIVTIPSTIFARRVGMIAVCGIGRPRGWRKRAVTANQSASAPTRPASNAAPTSRSQVAPGQGPARRATWLAIAPARATSSEMVPTWFRRGGADDVSAVESIDRATAMHAPSGATGV